MDIKTIKEDGVTLEQNDVSQSGQPSLATKLNSPGAKLVENKPTPLGTLGEEHNMAKWNLLIKRTRKLISPSN